MDENKSLPDSGQVQAVVPAVDSGKKATTNPILWVILVVLLLVIAVLGTMFATGVLKFSMFEDDANIEMSENDDEEDDGGPVADSDHDDEDDNDGGQAPGGNNDEPGGSNPGGSDGDADVTAGWSTYTNNTYNFSLKYPQDLTYSEMGALETGGFTVDFSSGATGVFSAKFVSAESGTPSNDVASQYLSNQCSDYFTYSEFEVGGRTFTRATEVPVQSCLASFGISRDIPLEGFAWKVDPTTYLILINHALNTEQLEGMLGSVEL